MAHTNRRTQKTYTKHYSPGFIYIATSPALKPKLYKVGYSSNPHRRMRELTEQAATALPQPYNTVFVRETQNMALAEEIAHAALAEYRVNEYREFFLVDLTFAKSVVAFACKRADGTDDAGDLTFADLAAIAPAPVPTQILALPTPADPEPVEAHIPVAPPSKSLLAIAHIARRSTATALILTGAAINLYFEFSGIVPISSAVSLTLIYGTISLRIDSHIKKISSQK